MWEVCDAEKMMVGSIFYFQKKGMPMHSHKYVIEK
jgi:hypothetical protein